MLSSVKADKPNVYVHSGKGTGVVDTAPVFPQSPPMTVSSSWTDNWDQTIEFWFKAEPRGTNTMPIVSVGKSNGYKLILSIRRGNHTASPGVLWLQLSNFNSHNHFMSTKRHDDGEWHHCAVVMMQAYSYFNLYFYIDGVEEYSTTKYLEFPFGDWGDTRIGDCSHLAAGYNLSGSPIDEIALYDKALSTDRILAHYNEVMAGPSGLSVAIAGQIDISGSVKTNKRVRLDTAQFDISGAVKTNKRVRLDTAKIDISGSLLIGKVMRLNTARIDIIGSLKTNKLVRLNTAQFDVDGFIRTLILKDPLPFSISSQIDIFGKVKAALVGKEVATSTRMQSSEIDTIVQTGIGVRI